VAFFRATFVDARRQMLRPTIFRKDPETRAAHRTSPTNLVCTCLLIVAAHDFGWMEEYETVERLTADARHDEADGKVPRAFLQLVRTSDLRPLDPPVRVVGGQRQPGGASDSRWAMSCREMIARPVVDRQWIEGIEGHDRAGSRVDWSVDRRSAQLTVTPIAARRGARHRCRR